MSSTRRRRESALVCAARFVVDGLERRLLLAGLNVTATSPANAGQNVAPSANAGISFNVAVNLATLADNVTLRGPDGGVLAATLGYDATSRTATLDPAANLAASGFYHVVVDGGAAGVRAQDGGSLDANYVFGFTAGTLAVQQETVFSGLQQPTAIEFAPGGKVFVAEKRGVIKVYDSIADTTPDTFADLRTEVHNFWDRGLLGLAVDPQFNAGRPYVYALYTRDAAIGAATPTYGTPNGDTDNVPDPTGAGSVVSGRLVRLTATGNTATATKTLVDDWGQVFPSHSIGHVQFGPDGKLYASAGDGASFNYTDWGQTNAALGDPVNEGGALRSQDLITGGDPTTLDGTIIRVDPDTGAAVAGNPLFNTGPDANAKRVVASGLRNPFRFTFRPNGELWSTDVGWTNYEELNRLVSPADGTADNFGWPAWEGPGVQASYQNANLPLLNYLYDRSYLHVAPYYAYLHSAKVDPASNEPTGSSSSTGVAFVGTAGGSLPDAYAGALVFADYSRNRVYVMPHGVNGDPSVADRRQLAQVQQPVELQTGPDGELYVVSLGGTVLRLKGPGSGGNRAPSAVLDASATSGPAPLTVNFSAAASLDPDPADVLSYAWDLDGDGAYDDSTAAAPTWTYASAGNVTVRLGVTDSAGASATASALVTVNNSAPVPTINSPATTFRWTVGQTVSFAGSAIDAQDGPLAASRLRWDVVLMHDNAANPGNAHEHPITSFDGVASGSFVAPDHEYPSWVELRLTATDSTGLATTTTRRLDPQTIALTFNTAPAGLLISVGGQARTGPFTMTALVGGSITVEAPTPQGGYAFVNWSDGATGPTRQLTVPASAASYTANYSLPTAPAAPTNLVVTSTSPWHARLAWNDNATNETGYLVQRRDAGSTTWANVDSLVVANAETYDDWTVQPGGSYVWRVIARGSVNSAPSNEATVGTQPLVPAQPTNLAASVVGSTANLAWSDNATNETGYRVERRASGGAWTTATTLGANAASYAALLSGSTDFRVFAFNNSGDSAASNVVTASPAGTTGVPAAPTGLTATPEDWWVNLAWVDAATNESSYVVQRRAAAGTQWKDVALLFAGATAFTDYNVVPGTGYAYQVYATNADGNGAASNVVSTTTRAVAYGHRPAEPTDLAATPGAAGIALGWVDASANEAGFRVERRSGTEWVTLATRPANSTTYTDATVTVGQAYTYRVVAQNDAGEAASDPVTATATAAPLPAPANLTATPQGATSMALAWTHAGGGNEEGFRVQRSPATGAATWTTIATLPSNSTSHTDSGLAAATTYRWRVVAFRGATEAASAAVTATTGSVPLGDGLTGRYYNGVNFSALRTTRVDPLLDFDWGTGAPAANVPADNFSVRWSGKLRAPGTGTFTFFADADDGVRLWVNGVRVINRWLDQRATHSGVLTLTEGRFYAVRFDYYERGGGTLARLRWSGPGVTGAPVVPTGALFSDANPTVPQALAPAASRTAAERETAADLVFNDEPVLF